jgi:electron transport complex protein RnfB
MADSEKKKKIDRRKFLTKGVRLSMATGVVGLGGVLLSKASKQEWVWQLDATKCVQCGRCATSCVLTPSAVKCMHVFDMCGYCDLCGGYFRPGVKKLSTAAENQLCPTAAIERKYIEKPYFEYHIIEELCMGCGKCVKGCSSFGNGSMQLQVNHSICVNCNECAIARDCPVDAFKRVPANDPYLFNGIMKTKEDKS